MRTLPGNPDFCSQFGRSLQLPGNTLWCHPDSHFLMVAAVKSSLTHVTIAGRESSSHSFRKFKKKLRATCPPAVWFGRIHSCWFRFAEFSEWLCVLPSSQASPSVQVDRTSLCLLLAQALFGGKAESSVSHRIQCDKFM